jgi:hypothetical protein
MVDDQAGGAYEITPEEVGFSPQKKATELEETTKSAFKVGDLVSSPDRGNVGEVRGVNEDQVLVRFVNPKTGCTTEKYFPAASLRLLPHGGGKAGMRGRRHVAVPPYVPFPVHTLPEAISRYITISSTAIGCDPAFVALPLLAALASAIGNTRRIRLKQGWCEPAVIWAVIVGLSGSLKSPAIDAALRGLWKLQDKAFKEFSKALAEYRRQVTLYSRDLTRWKRKKDGSPPPDRPEEPIALRHYCSDATVEALAVLLANQWRGILLYRDELSGWVAGFNQYKAGKGGDVAHWLEMHGGRPMLVDRKTGPTKTLHVPRAAVSVCGGIQPGALRRALKQEHFEDGLAARLLLASPPRKPKQWTDASIPPAEELALQKLFEHLYSLKPNENADGELFPVDVDLTAEAKELWIKFYDAHAKEQAELTGDLCAAWSKLEGYAARIALVIHFVRWAANDPTVGEFIDEKSIAAGIELSQWFGNETRRVYAVLAQSEDDEEQQRQVEIVQARGGSISVRDWQKNRSLSKAEDAEAELQELVEAGLGRWDHPPPGPKGGRPSKRFHLVETSHEEGETPAGEARPGVSSASVLSSKVACNQTDGGGDHVEPAGSPPADISSPPRDVQSSRASQDNTDTDKTGSHEVGSGVSAPAATSDGILKRVEAVFPDARASGGGVPELFPDAESISWGPDNA